jgi:hypothetical protein
MLQKHNPVTGREDFGHGENRQGFFKSRGLHTPLLKLFHS